MAEESRSWHNMQQITCSIRADNHGGGTKPNAGGRGSIRQALRPAQCLSKLFRGIPKLRRDPGGCGGTAEESKEIISSQQISRIV